MAGAGAVAAARPGWAFARRRAQTAETMIVGGRVLAMDASVRGATAVAVAGGKLIAVGSDDEVRALAGAATETIDAGGATVMPGIHDGHSHPFDGGTLLTQPSLNYAILDLEQFKHRVARLLKKTADREPDGWMEVQLWDATAMDRLPTKRDLDELPTQRPILVYSLDGHIALANSRALQIAGIDASTPDPPGGEIRRGPGREPTGILLDDAIGLVSSKVPPPTPGAGRRRARSRLRADGRGRDHNLPARVGPRARAGRARHARRPRPAAAAPPRRALGRGRGRGGPRRAARPCR